MDQPSSKRITIRRWAVVVAVVLLSFGALASLIISRATDDTLSGSYVLRSGDQPDEPSASQPPLGDGVFPTPESTGVPAGWVPTRTVHGDYTISTPDAVVEDLRVVDGRILVRASDVTLRRVEVVGGAIGNRGDGCHDGLLIEDSTIRRGNAPTDTDGSSAISTGSYVARRVLIDGVPEGFRIGGGRCGPVVIEDSYAQVVAPDVCGDWHGDTLQGFRGSELVVRNTVLVFVEREDCHGTSAFFYPDQGNTSVDIDGLIVEGGGYAFRLATPGVVTGLGIVSGGWRFGPILVECALVSAWEAHIVTLDADGQPVPERDLPCDT